MILEHAMSPTAEPDPRQRLGMLFDRQQARLFRLARRMLPGAEEARDAVQECFLRAARHAARLPASDGGAEAWLVRTLINLCRDHHRRRAVRRRAAENELAGGRDDAGGDPEDALVARAAVRRALAVLDPRRRAIVVLHELEGRPVAEVAALLGVARVTVRWHLSRARRLMAAELAPRPAAGRGGGER
ncbi:MAG: sigma-70 family RNA polymerase sigma factor [Acidobacteria bacterium]|nr:MAG: sigma-70 family RNA polymerase sigma factor [Acidobacteriota bacterium]